MHIADGVLPLSVTLATSAAALVGVGWSLRRLDMGDLPKIAVVTSSFFVASLMHLPLGPTSVHLLLPGLVGALMGSAALLSVGIGLFLQCVLFQFGGLTSLGANTLMMGLPALVCGWVFQRIRGDSQRSHLLAGALVSAGGVLMAGLLLAGLLTTAGEDFWGVAKLALAAHVPVMLIEAGVGASTIAFLYKVKPEMLNRRGVQ